MASSQLQNPDTAEGISPSLLAWAGWQLQMPDEWRPLKMYGTAKKGWMIVGDAICAFFSIHWEQPRRSTVSDGDEWIQGRMEKLGVLPDPRPPAADRFSSCAWAHGVESEEDKKTTYWFGYAQPAELLVGVKVNGVLPDDQREQVTHGILPTLSASAADKPSTWALHDLSFEAPPDFDLSQKHLFAGDVALEFRKGCGESLLLRQVYPGGLALKRRAAVRWLQRYPFKEHRRIRKSTVVRDEWRDSSERGLSGLRHHARKRLGMPLGWASPRYTHGLAVHDEEFDRLLIAEHMSAGEPDERVAEEAIRNMNRFMREAR